MPKTLRPYLPALALLAGSGLLILILLLEWWSDHSRRSVLRADRPAGTAEIAAEADAGDVGLKALEEYGQMVERPLFQDSRRPVEAEEPGLAGATEQTPLDFKLMGVVLVPQGKSALFMDARNKYKRARLNAKVNGWTLVKIGEDRVTLEQAGEQKELLLLKPKPKAATPAPPPKGKAQINTGAPPPPEGEVAEEPDQNSAEDEETPPDEPPQP
ncbi:hypothetical protein [Methylococcus sp. EFPC2]|uniref:hypothetical protein n=1 Tax=Methylococcus sp. EFPC2 TaxID=2812648 RepID=UPI001967278B|nr:hypothetical protein [Methylococcus sp. EFPC2]QSA96703.1 hypothetical protein JWZ97_16050 [Methylococcus sp. EFPC2]